MNQLKTKENQTAQKPNSIIRVAVIDEDESFLATIKRGSTLPRSSNAPALFMILKWRCEQ